MGRTKKIGAAGKFGARYGIKIRKRFLEVNKKLKSKNMCPSCQSDKLKRVSSGIYECKKCGKKMTGGAYTP